MSSGLRPLSTSQYDAIRRAMEDVQRQSRDYYLDLKSMEVVALPVALLKEAEALLYETETDYEFGVLYDSAVRAEAVLEPEHEQAIEKALEILSEPARYVRIPERPSWHAYECMRAFALTLKGPVKEALLNALNGPGAFSRFKAILKEHKKLHKAWHAYNSKAMIRFIDRWIESFAST